MKLEPHFLDNLKLWVSLELGRLGHGGTLLQLRAGRPHSGISPLGAGRSRHTFGELPPGVPGRALLARARRCWAGQGPSWAAPAAPRRQPPWAEEDAQHQLSLRRAARPCAHVPLWETPLQDRHAALGHRLHCPARGHPPVRPPPQSLRGAVPEERLPKHPAGCLEHQWWARGLQCLGGAEPSWGELPLVTPK